MQFRPIDEVVRDIHIRDAKEEGMKRGMEKGIEKGMEKGIEKGIEKGMEKGKIEGMFNVARSMLSDGFSAETIRKHTGLDESSILSLRQL